MNDFNIQYNLPIEKQNKNPFLIAVTNLETWKATKSLWVSLQQSHK